MIVGVAQVVLNVADLEVSSQPYLQSGWKETFAVQALPNHPAKAAMQARPRTALDMVHLTPPDGMAVELTRYAGDPPQGEPAYDRFDGAGVHVSTHRLGESRRFWSALGFREGDCGILEARALVPAWRLRLTLEPVSSPRPAASIDADGCVLVTMLTTSLGSDLRRLEETHTLIRSTAAWQEQITGRRTEVAIVEGPGGELVELLQAPRADRDD